MDLYHRVKYIKKDMLSWLRGREHHAINVRSATYSCKYYVEAIKIRRGVMVNHPEVVIDVRVVKYYREGRVVKTKPISAVIRFVNERLRSIIKSDISWGLRMFDIKEGDYLIKIGTIKWGLE